ncbi:hypothetical protein HG530_002532 [Fusarium avenaceum]|nr:hypothetical protein HG530_002532 [Fusarium avenaceum]
MKVGVVVNLAEACQSANLGISNLGANSLTFLLNIDTESLLHSSLCFCIRLAIRLSVDCGLLELHNVLSEGTGLIRENRDWHQVLEQDDGSPEGDETAHSGCSTNGSEIEEVERRICFCPCNAVDNGSKQTHDKQDAKVTNNVEVHLSRNASTLARSDTSIHHDLGVMSGIDNDANDPLGVSKVTATTVVFVEVGLWTLTFDHELGALTISGMLERSSATHGLANLEIGLAIQILRFDITGSIWVGSSEDDDIGRQFLVVIDTNKIADNKTFPGIFLESGT